MKYVGVDPSLTSPGLAILHEGGGVFLRQNLVTRDLRGGDRLQAIFGWASDAVFGCQGATAVIEGYAMAAQNRPFDLGEAGGVLRLVLTQASIPYVVVPPALVKKYVTGNGQATKKQVQDCIERNWGLRIVQEDQADAYGMARLAEALATGVTQYPFQLDVLAKIQGVRLKKTPTPRKSLTNI